jgi:hypothetical protein
MDDQYTPLHLYCDAIGLPHWPLILLGPRLFNPVGPKG